MRRVLTVLVGVMSDAAIAVVAPATRYVPTCNHSMGQVGRFVTAPIDNHQQTSVCTG
jgi:hypothetical protein